MKTTALGIFGGLLLGISAWPLYQGLATGMLTCAHRNQSPACEANYVRTGVAEAGVAAGLASVVAALWSARPRRPRQPPGRGGADA